MDISVENQSNALVFVIKGRLDGSTAPELQETLMSQLGGAPVIIIDCAGLDYIASAGLRVLLMATKECKKSRRSFGLCQLQEDVQEVFRISGFSSIIDTFASREQALEMLASSA